MGRVSFLVPGGIDRVTGGNIYDRAMIDELTRRGRSVEVLEPPAPRGDEDVVVVDSMAFRFGRPQWRTPYVALAHQIPSAAIGFPAPTVQERDVFRFASLVVTVSEWLAEDVGRLTSAPVVVVPPGRDRVPDGTEPAPDANAILVVANAVPGKGVAEAIDAFARADVAGAPLVLVGDLEADPDEGAGVREAIDRCPSTIETPGVLNAGELLDRYRRARLLLTASRYEGRPTVVIEAMTAGIPVCGYDVPGMRELVRAGRDGILARAGDVDDLATCLRDMLEDTDLTNAMGRAARRRSETWPTWRESAERFADAIESVTGDQDTVAR